MSEIRLAGSHIHKSVNYLFSVEFKPPQISAQCFENGTASFNWNISPDQDLSVPYLDYHLFGWILSGNCSYANGTNPNGTNPISKVSTCILILIS